jgi:hypothetical protein
MTGKFGFTTSSTCIPSPGGMIETASRCSRQGRSSKKDVLKSRIAEGISKSLHHIWPDHVGTVSGKPPFRQIKRSLTWLCLTRNTPHMSYL